MYKKKTISNSIAPKSKPQDWNTDYGWMDWESGGRKMERAADPDGCVWFWFFFFGCMHYTKPRGQLSLHIIPFQWKQWSGHSISLFFMPLWHLHFISLIHECILHDDSTSMQQIISVHVTHVMDKYSAQHTYLCKNTLACIHANAQKYVVQKKRVSVQRFIAASPSTLSVSAVALLWEKYFTITLVARKLLVVQHCYAEQTLST